MTEQET